MSIPSRAGARLGIFLLASMILACKPESARIASQGDSPGAEPEQEKRLSWSMSQWREAREEAESAFNAPRGDERVARCEAFLAKYPDYPEARRVIFFLIEATIDRGSFDPAALASLIERLADSGSPHGFSQPEHYVDRYYFKHSLPLDSAERLLRKARAGIAAEREAAARETQPRRREEALERVAGREVALSLSEGRVLLARKDYEGAINKLLEAESDDGRRGKMGLTLVDSGGRVVRNLPTGSPQSDKLNLALATAHARLGNRKEAAERLGRVRNFLPDFYPEIGPAVQALREELAAPPPARREVRAEPKPVENFRLKDLDGRDVALSDFRDRVVLAMFWATW